VKDQTGKENREFAPRKRNPDDKYKVTVIKKEPDYEVVKDGTRPIVRKKEHEIKDE